MPRILIGNVKGPQGEKGDTGATGAPGEAASVRVGAVETVAYGQPAAVTNTGTDYDAVFNFRIPQGAPGQAPTGMGNLLLDSMTESTAEYPVIAVDERGATVFGKIKKFLNDLLSAVTSINTNGLFKSNLVNGFTQTTPGVNALDAAAGKSLNDSLSNCATKTELTNSLSDLVKMQWVVAAIPANNTVARSVSATIPSGYKWLGWTRAMTTGWVGYVYPAGGGSTTDFWTNSSATDSDRNFTAYYLVIKDIS